MYTGYRHQPRSDSGFSEVLYFVKMQPTKFRDRKLMDACVSPRFRPYQIITSYSLASIGTNFGPTFVHICQMERLNDGHTNTHTHTHTHTHLKQTNMNKRIRARAPVVAHT